MAELRTNEEAIAEDELISRIQSGEAALYEFFVKRYNGRLCRTSRRIVGNDADVDDIVQETHLKAFVHISQFRGMASFSTWLLTIATNESLLHLRRRLRTQEWACRLDGEEDGTGGILRTIRSDVRDPEQETANQELRNELESAILSLPSHYRIVFVLREVEQLNTAQVVRRLGVSEACVKSRLKRAKNLLRHRLRGLKAA